MTVWRKRVGWMEGQGEEKEKEEENVRSGKAPCRSFERPSKVSSSRTVKAVGMAKTKTKTKARDLLRVF